MANVPEIHMAEHFYFKGYLVTNIIKVQEVIAKMDFKM